MRPPDIICGPISKEFDDLALERLGERRFVIIEDMVALSVLVIDNNDCDVVLRIVDGEPLADFISDLLVGSVVRALVPCLFDQLFEVL